MDRVPVSLLVELLRTQRGVDPVQARRSLEVLLRRSGYPPASPYVTVKHAAALSREILGVAVPAKPALASPRGGKRIEERRVPESTVVVPAPRQQAVAVAEVVSASLTQALAILPDRNGCRAEAASDRLRSRWPALSPREADVVLLIAGGHTNEQIAALLHLSLNTVKTYARTAFGKLGVANRAQATAKAILQAGVEPATLAFN